MPSEFRIFYSWQSDLPNSTNRGLIGTGLENTARALRQDDTIKVEPVIDRDTLNVSGAPDIGATIFRKIEQAQAFVCDVSLITAPDANRPAPNPNVLIELGYAIKTLGWERIIMVMNTAYGSPERLPFDLRQKRVLGYTMDGDTDERAPERRVLEGKLGDSLRLVLRHGESQSAAATPTLIGDAIIAIENNEPRQTALVRKFMEDLVEQLVTLAPDFSQAVEPDELLLAALGCTIEPVQAFSRLAEVIAVMDSCPAATALIRGFGKLLEHYRPPRGFSGAFNERDHDLYRFLGHELLVLLHAYLIREDRWELLAQLDVRNIPVSNAHNSSSLVDLSYGSQSVTLLEQRRHRLKALRVSLHADLLKERHDQGGPLAAVVSWQEFMDADCFLFLRTVLPEPPTEFRNPWRAYSTLFMDGFRSPIYLNECQSKSKAVRVVKALGLESIEMFQARLAGNKHLLGRLFRESLFHDPLEDFDPAKIGTRP